MLFLGLIIRNVGGALSDGTGGPLLLINGVARTTGLWVDYEDPVRQVRKLIALALSSE